MKKNEDFLVEIRCEELPPKSLLKTTEVFCQQFKEKLRKLELSFDDIKFFATPRRIAIFVKDLVDTQPDQIVERKGPALEVAFDEKGNPTEACVGFARSCGVPPSELTTINNAHGAWVGVRQTIPGKPITELLPAIIEQLVINLPMPKRMRWGDKDLQFARPIHSVMMLYGDKILEGKILDCVIGRVTRGHPFHAPDTYTVLHAAEYESLLRNEGFVIADFESRRSEILGKAKATVENTFQFNASVSIDHALLDEVTGLVEWPVILIGHFDKTFLTLPPEVLISAMQDHQRYFPIVDKNHGLLPYFVIVSNIQSRDSKRVISGNERVLRARLADAAFFYATDKKNTLQSRIKLLEGMIYQTKLGTLYDRAERLSRLSNYIAKKMNTNSEHAEQAAWLAKTDLTTQMVGEFTELQGMMGYYYARHDGLDEDIAQAIRDHYLPRFAGDYLPENAMSQVVALADKLDTLVGIFGINQIPTGDKDPYGLRRAALGIIRILIEKKINLDVSDLLSQAVSNFKIKLENTNVIPMILNFIQERLRSWYQEQDVHTDVFASVAALNIYNLCEMDLRIQAVQTFKKLPEAQALSIANKRVTHILAKYHVDLSSHDIHENLFEHEEEKKLAKEIKVKTSVTENLLNLRHYEQILLQLAELRQPVDDFFDKVMVMTEDKLRRENRILLLRQLRALFLQVADIALLQ